ncbi:pb-reticulocyte binding protein, putative [Babesia caballi]|uniref:Pb-reticulocyte binding protein, putative n=1 Tax=Babesia caballi TaxID=5871 RepID=A0AAV4LW02_BABCB|nr:pb-reticulocyte binding protein, putative [Babesia caballi]
MNRQHAAKEPETLGQSQTVVAGDPCCVATSFSEVVQMGFHWLRWLFLGPDEEEAPAPASKRDRKRRVKDPLFSKRFIHICSVFGVLILGTALFGLVRILGLMPAPKLPGFTYLKVGNAKQVKAAMSQSGPRIVYCSNVKMPPELHRAAMLGVKQLPAWINRFALDCSATLPSGKTAYERFQVDPASTIMFVQAHGKRAIALNELSVANPQHFVSTVVRSAAHAIKRVYDVESFNGQLAAHASRLLLILTDGRKFSMYNSGHSMAISQVIDANRLYGLSTWLVNDGIHEVREEFSGRIPPSSPLPRTTRLLAATASPCTASSRTRTASCSAPTPRRPSARPWRPSCAPAPAFPSVSHRTLAYTARSHPRLQAAPRRPRPRGPAAEARAAAGGPRRGRRGKQATW